MKKDNFLIVMLMALVGRFKTNSAEKSQPVVDLGKPHGAAPSQMTGVHVPFGRDPVTLYPIAGPQ